MGFVDWRMADRPGSRAVGTWLLALAGMVFVMVLLGGLTRLTGSGLSMVEWQPFAVLPPLSAADWGRVFDAYKETPQYRLENAGMTLAGFKGIFWLEYIHRIWGRLIGAAFLIPFVWFVATGRIRRREAPRLFLLFLAGALQGALGWAMVASGLEAEPRVSHIRLAAHLAAALVLYAALLWLALLYLEAGARIPWGGANARLRACVRVALALICLTIPAGALVAGLHAGMIYETFPLMGGTILPGEAFDLAPWVRNFVDNPTLVQFDHRILAIATFLASMLAWAWSRQGGLAPRAARALGLVGMAALIQVALGIATLLLGVPLPYAEAHQAGAFLLFTALLWAAFETR